MPAASNWSVAARVGETQDLSTRLDEVITGYWASGGDRNNCEADVIKFRTAVQQWITDEGLDAHKPYSVYMSGMRTPIGGLEYRVYMSPE